MCHSLAWSSPHQDPAVFVGENLTLGDVRRLTGWEGIYRLAVYAAPGNAGGREKVRPLPSEGGTSFEILRTLV